MASASLPLPTERLFSILITFLVPLFLDGETDLATARAAAIEMLRSFRIRNAWDLLVTVQIVGFAVAALGSLGLSMTEGLPVGAVLRCRANANALQRSSDRARDRLERHQALDTTPHIEPLDEAALQEAMRQVDAAHRAVAAARAQGNDAGNQDAQDRPVAGADHAPRAQAAEIGPAPGAPVAATTATIMPSPWAAAAQPAVAGAAPLSATGPDSSEPHPGVRMAFATAMATVATELAQEMRHLPPAEQRMHRTRIAALSEASQQLSRGEPLDPPFAAGFGLPEDPRPRLRA